ncbi:hypothetical protein BpHYR1_026229 [Brachionus plicatilis]|uniref:Uncharacterized protein n=1 Tax=Brachionus plicatilis TaxID=10195 RepID=A0A3M7T403_BRAPC|nr:hypothetical protein BpHYR1_026229 [Brachionus plicatilis]
MPSWPAKWPPAKKLAGFLATRIFLAVYFGGLKIRPPSWPVKWPQKTVRVMDRFVLAASNTNPCKKFGFYGQSLHIANLKSEIDVIMMNHKLKKAKN